MSYFKGPLCRIYWNLLSGMEYNIQNPVFNIICNYKLACCCKLGMNPLYYKGGGSSFTKPPCCPAAVAQNKQTYIVWLPCFMFFHDMNVEGTEEKRKKDKGK